MREGTITSRCERGIDSDAGRYRLTFFYENARCRLIVNETGSVVKRSITEFGDRLPTSLRKRNS
jgi:hypothetical protein